MLNYQSHDALGLAERVRSGQVSARELLHEAQAGLARVNSKLNAVICPMDSLAESLAKTTDIHAPFCGVPFLVKDLMLPFAGYPLSNGSVAMKGYIPEKNCAMADRFQQMGLVTFAKTNAAELGASPLTVPEAFGATRNPWNLDRNSGGSSGGSAAAVAARVVPMAYASDGGGSIRLPASYCGIFGYKPSRGLNRYEDMTKAWGDAVVSHVCTVSVRDSAAYLDLTSREGTAWYSMDSPPQDSYLHATLRPPPRLRIALITDSPTRTPVHEECVTAAQTAARYCDQLGHHVDTCSWNFDGIELMRAFLTIVFRFTAGDVDHMSRLLNQSQRHIPLELNTRFMAVVGTGISNERVEWARSVWNATAKKLSEFHERYDLILTPTVATPPLRSDGLNVNVIERAVMRLLIATGLGKNIYSNRFLDTAIHKQLYLTPFTPIANITGQPAMTVPLYWDSSDLPHGAHFMAKEGNDALLFSLAAELEKAYPWGGKVPEISAK